jgi:hypothetical protein
MLLEFASHSTSACGESVAGVRTGIDWLPKLRCGSLLSGIVCWIESRSGMETAANPSRGAVKQVKVASTPMPHRLRHLPDRHRLETASTLTGLNSGSRWNPH